MPDLLALIQRIPGYIYALWTLWLLLTAGLAFLTSRRLSQAKNGATSIAVTGSANANLLQAGRDINLIGDIRSIRQIQSFTVEARLTCTLKGGAHVPPGEVEFVPVGDSHAYLDGSPGRERLSFVSPVRFRLVGGDRVTAVNQFSLQPSSSLLNRPIEALVPFQKLSLPIVTVVFGNALETITLLEVTITVNGQVAWYASWNYDLPFQQGPRFDVPLDDFHRRVSQ